MSRIGNFPIPIPEDVSINVGSSNGKDIVTVKGKLGELSHTLNSGISIVNENNKVQVSRTDDSKDQRALHGLTRALLSNLVVGVSKGYEKQLHIIGTGYAAEVKGSWLRLVLGYSHDILMRIPEHLTVEAESVPRSRGKKSDVQVIIKVKGISKEAVGSFSAEIRRCRPPENYKGKGIRYSDETVAIKAGKTGA